MNAEHPDALYVHIPFCRHICWYCDFCRTVYSEAQADAFLAALDKEFSLRKFSVQLDTIYIGGGTPTSLNERQLERLLQLLAPYAREVREYTVEINPETLSEEKAALLAEYGVNRASIGMQSSDAGLLKLMNRRHTFTDVQSCTERLQRHGIENFSLDLMYSLPGQTMKMLESSVEDALSLNPYHLSLYSLSIEENSVFGKRGYEALDEETEADMYEYICRRLQQAGYEHYETSNFARDGKRSLHNTVYWQYRDFYGAGCGASGKEGNVRYDLTRSLKEYIQDPLKRQDTVLTPQEQYFEALMMSLRLREGLDKARFFRMFGVSIDDVYRDEIAEECRRGMLVNTDERLYCTDRGWNLLNEILVDFIA